MKTLPLFVFHLGLGFAASQNALADLTQLEGEFQNEIQQRAAIANQAVYDQLLEQGCSENFGEFGTTDEIIVDENTEMPSIKKTALAGVGRSARPEFSCTGNTLKVWENVRKFVHTANEISDANGPTDASMGLNTQELGDALQWAAGEEYSTQESMTKSFSEHQLADLSTRISTLRTRSASASLTHNSSNYSGLNAGDATQDTWSPWGGFLNGSYGKGQQSESQRENGFDLTSSEINAGIDYRINNQWVVGALLSYRDQDVDFDASSVVDGQVSMTGWSLLPFLLYQNEQWFSSVSAGYQWNDFSTQRSVRFDSNYAWVDGANTEAKSSNDSNTFNANWAGGYGYQVNDAFTIEPTLGVNYQKVSISQFEEKDMTQAGYNLLIDEQNIKSLESYFGLKAQYLFNTQHGIFMPFVSVQAMAQHETDDRFVTASYADVADFLSGDALFYLPTNTPDSDYKVIEVGVSAVLKGASQRSLDSAAYGGIQAFITYRELVDLNFYEQKTISGGIRYEF